MVSLALFCSVLLVYSTAVCVGQEDNSLNTGTLLREEIKKLVKDALAELMPDLSSTCNSTENQPDQELVNSVKELKDYAKDFNQIHHSETASKGIFSVNSWEHTLSTSLLLQ